MNELKQRKSDLYQEAFSNDPDLLQSKRRIGIFMMIYAVSYMLLIIAETIVFVDVNLPVSYRSYIILALAVWFAYLIYKGSKGLLILMIINGFWTALELTKRDIIGSFQMENMLFNFYTCMLIAVCILQIVIPIYMLTNKNFSKYFSKIKEINQMVMQHINVKK